MIIKVKTTKARKEIIIRKEIKIAMKSIWSSWKDI